MRHAGARTPMLHAREFDGGDGGTRENFPVLGMGPSAGEIDAFPRFLDHMPADCGMAFVMILHLPAGRKSVLVDILSRWTTMPVIDAVHGTRLEPNHVYVPPPHSLVSLDHGVLGVLLP